MLSASFFFQTFPSPPPRFNAAMTLDALRDYCLAKPGATEDMPFGPDVLVFRVRGKMFALTNLESIPPSVNLKCDPERAVELRERHPEIRPGYHVNKRHWNTIDLGGRLSNPVVHELIDHSYALVVAGLPRTERDALASA